MGETNASRADVARLFGRAAFGATSRDLDAFTGQPYETVVDAILVRPDANLRTVQPDEATRTNLAQTARYNIDQCQRWWMERMRNGLYPVEERMTLFWHDHFATGFGPTPFARALMLQNQTIRTHALGNFRDLCNALTVDCSMLEWLNGEQNAVIRSGSTFIRRVNENYAREFFELFTLGVQPQVYQEYDIEQSARAFTGWTCYSTDAAANDAPNASRFTLNRHDRDQKVVLGTPVGGPGTDEANEYKAITDIALAQPVAPYFVAYKLVQNFGYEPVVVDRDVLVQTDPLVAKVATALQQTNWDLKAGLRAMLVADEWRYATLQRVRQPVELIAHAAKALRVTADDADLRVLAQRMGQLLFQPPNVAGWPNNRAWLSQSTMIARYDLGIRLFPKWGLKATSPAPADLAGWASLLGVAGWSATTTAAVNNYLAARPGATADVKKTAVLTLLLCSPDWQVM